MVQGVRRDNIRGDIFGGLTAAVVALPLALAFGVASGAGPVAGLYGAIAGDIEDAPLSDEARAILKLAGGQLLVFHLEGPMCFGGAKGMGRSFSIADKFEAVVPDLADVPMIDSSAVLAVEHGIRNAGAKGCPVFIAGVGFQVEEVLERLGVLDHLPAGHRFRARAAALRHALEHIEPAVGAAPAQTGEDRPDMETGRDSDAPTR